MIIDDRVYGEFNIEEPVLVDIINSDSFKRLKGVSQYGMPDDFWHVKGFSRYSHSIGVMLLLRKFNASIKEQIAGLLHDISHLAFSHVGEWAVSKGRDETYHEFIREEYITKTNIDNILLNHNYDIEDFKDERGFTLLERPIPYLCADRIDYTLRELKISLDKDLTSVLDDLVVKGSKFVFQSVDSALVFGKNFVELQDNHWNSRIPVGKYYHFSKMLKKAVKKGIIDKEDFYKNESFIMNKLVESNNNEVKNFLEKLKLDSLDQFEKDGEKIVKKFRYVDPWVLIDGELNLLSDINIDFKNLLEEKRKKTKRGHMF